MLKKKKKLLLSEQQPVEQDIRCYQRKAPSRKEMKKIEIGDKN